MITEYFKKKLGENTIPEPTNSAYRCWNTGGVEAQVGTFLYGLTQLMQPKRILETGTHHGVSAAYFAQALKDNGTGGMLTTIEHARENIEVATKRLSTLGLMEQVVMVNDSSLNYTPQDRFQLMFLDTEMWLRLKEVARFYPYLDEGGYMFIHDIPSTQCRGNKNPDHPDMINWPIGEIPKEFDDLLKEKKLLPFYFFNPRGMMGLYKPTKQDYI